MEQPVKTIRIKEGKVLVSPMVEPEEPTCIFTYAQEIEWLGKYERELDAYNASFIEVGNMDDVEIFEGLEFPTIHYSADGTTLHLPSSGTYSVAEGLTMIVREVCKPVIHHGSDFAANRLKHGCSACHDSCLHRMKVATVKFTPAEKPKITGGYQPENTVDTSNPPRQSAAEKEEKPDLITKWRNVIDIGASSYSWSVLGEMFNDFQQEITTLRAENERLQYWKKENIEEVRADCVSVAVAEATEDLMNENEKLRQELSTYKLLADTARARIAELEASGTSGKGR